MITVEFKGVTPPRKFVEDLQNFYSVDYKGNFIVITNLRNGNTVAFPSTDVKEVRRNN